MYTRIEGCQNFGCGLTSSQCWTLRNAGWKEFFCIKFAFLWDVMLCRLVCSYQWTCLSETKNNAHRVKFMMLALWDFLMILKNMNVNGGGRGDDILIIVMILVIVMVAAVQFCLKIIVKISNVKLLKSSYLLSKCLKIWKWNVIITEQV